MKVAVLKLGSRISYNSKDTSGGNGEARSLINMMDNAGIDVHVYTKILKKDILIPNISWHNILDDYKNVQDYDAVIVINGMVNFFGGCEDRAQILNYHIIQNFNGPVFYLHCDPALKFTQIWKSVNAKEWGQSYKEEDIFITKEPIVITQQYNIDEVAKIYTSKNAVKPKEIIHYPFEQFPMMLNPLEFNENPLYDLSYGGTMRGGKREDNIVRYYFGYPENISVNVFGKIQEKNFKSEKIKGLRQPEYDGPIKYDDMLYRMNQSLSHVVIGDKQYSSIEMINQRVYESINASVVTFVDIALDTSRRIYKNDKALCDFLYVKNREQVITRINQLKDNPDIRKEIIRQQFNAVNFDKNKYCKGLCNIISKYS